MRLSLNSTVTVVAIRVPLLERRMRYAWYSVGHVVATGFPCNSSIRFGDHKIFLLHDLVDSFVYSASSASV